MKMNKDKEELQVLNTKFIEPQITSNGAGIKKNEPLGLRRKAVFRQVLMCVLANLSVISTGMAMAYPAVTLDQLKDPKEKITLSSSQASWFASINMMACPLGGLLSGYLLDKVGRKKTLVVINITAVIAWGLIAVVNGSNNEIAFIQIMIGRFIIGIATGLASSPVGVYSAEVCHPNLRGRLTLGTSVSTSLGIMLSYVLGYFIRNDWRLLSGIACIYSILAAILTIPVPESPNWLIMKGRNKEAEKSLRFFRGLNNDVEARHVELDCEMDKLINTISNSGQHAYTLKKMIRKPEVYKPLAIMIGFFAFQQFSGIFAVIVYAVQFSIEAGVSIDPILCAVLVGATRVLTTFVVGYILDKWGRRPPAMISGFGMGVSMFLLAALIWYPNLLVSYLSVICVIVYILTSTLGLLTLPFSMIAEVFPQHARGFASGLTICFGYTMAFISIKLYPSMVDNWGKEYVFIAYGIVSFIAVIYCYFYLPETNKRTLFEIEEYFKYGKFQNENKMLNIELKEININK